MNWKFMVKKMFNRLGYEIRRINVLNKQWGTTRNVGNDI